MSGINVFNRYPRPTPGVSGQSLAVSSGSVSLFGTTAVNKDTMVCLLDAQNANIVVTFGGETPAVGTGHLMVPGTSTGQMWVSKMAASTAKFIRTSSDAVLYCSEWTL